MRAMDRFTLDRIRVAANGVDVQTVRRVLAGDPRVRPSCRYRVHRALVELGMTTYVRAPVAIDHSPKTRA